MSSNILSSTGDLSLSISASASDLKHHSGASDGESSQTLSRTKDAKRHYGKAARAFLQKDYLTALVHSQITVAILTSAAELGSSVEAIAQHQSERDRLIEKVAILRLTVLTHVYTDINVKQDMLDHLDKQADGGRIVLLLSKLPNSLIAHLWFEVLRLCSQTSGDADAPSLDPTPETIHLAIELPASVVSSAVLAALRLDSMDRSDKIGTQAARQIAEWYLASYSAFFNERSPTDKALEAYEKIVALYALHVLATRLGEWEFAREFVGYASLPESIKFGLLEQINEAQAHLLNRPEREQEATTAALQAYQAEKASRAAEEKAAKNDSSKAAKTAAPLLTPSSAGSDSGRNAPPARSQSPAYFSPQSNGASTSSTSTSPAISPGSSRSTHSSRQTTPPASDGSKSGRKSSKRLTRSPSDHDITSHEKEDAGYAATRAHLSRYIKKDHSSKPDSITPKASAATAPWSISSAVSTLKFMLDIRRSQPRKYILSAIIMLFVFYRATRRPKQTKARNVGASATARSAAVQNARNKLAARTQSAPGVLGIGWILIIWRKVMDTIKMGTQVTYL